MSGENGKKSWFQRLREGLGKSANSLSSGIAALFGAKRKLDDETLEDLEDLLITSDFGVATATRFSSELSASRYDRDISAEEVREVLARVITEALEPVAKPLAIDPGHRPHVILVVGVNGSGKTTTIGKLARQLQRDGKSVMMAAGDTFRAAAIEQLQVWGERNRVPVVAHKVGADAAAVAFDALTQAKESGTDVVLVDTAGRLQNKQNLMDELAKIVRVIRRFDESAPHDTLLVLDATTGQNAVQQVEVFQQVANVTGLIMTKLDGTARGGVLVACAEKFGLPIHAIGVGETIDDLRPFRAEEFAEAIAGSQIEQPG